MTSFINNQTLFELSKKLKKSKEAQKLFGQILSSQSIQRTLPEDPDIQNKSWDKYIVVK